MNETQALIQHLGQFSYLGIFGISILANVVVPVPEEVVLLALGYLARGGRANIFYLIPIVMAGLLVSDIVMYTLSKHNNRLLTRFYNRFFAKRLAGREAWIETHIEKVIFFSRFLIQLRFLGPFIAGQRKVSWKKFLTYELAALVIYVPLVLWAGWYFRSRIDKIVAGIGLVRNGILIAVGITLLISLSKYIRNRTFKAR
ncbi:MAG TPA: VTT domain-containing protein [Candidatus Paceibacterota bacterium]|nr:VTT domain-containing protein [Candidatus Paceibacterota bacterium]